MIKIVIQILIIFFCILAVLLFFYNYKRYSFKFILLMPNKNSVFLFKFVIILIVFLIIALNYNSNILNKEYRTLDSAINATQPEKKLLIVNDNDLKLYAMTDKDNHTYLVEFKKEHNYWKINNNFFTDIQGKTRYKISDANVLYYIYVIPYEINDKLVVYIKCVEGKYNTNYCRDVKIEDVNNNTFTFVNDNYDYKLINDMKKDDYYYIFDGVSYGL